MGGHSTRRPPVENGRYTDEFNEEYSNDIEPQAGGHGDHYYQSMKTHITQFKGPSRTGPIGGAGGKCVDVSGDDTGATGAPIQLWDCLGAADQQWTVGTDGTIRTMGKCMDVEGYGTANFTKIHLWDCHGGANQQWQPRPDGSILNPVSGRCLDDNAGNTTNGQQLQLYDCNGQWPQVFRLP